MCRNLAPSVTHAAQFTVVLLFMLAMPAPSYAQAARAFSSPLDGEFDQNGTERKQAEDDMEAYRKKSNEEHKSYRPKTAEIDPEPVPGMIPQSESHEDACGTCIHMIQTNYSYFSVWVTDDDPWPNPDDDGAFTSMSTFATAVGGDNWGAARDIRGTFFVCFGYSGPHCTPSLDHPCGAEIHQHCDELWELESYTHIKGGGEHESTDETEKNKEISGGGTASEDVSYEGEGHAAKGGEPSENDQGKGGKGEAKKGKKSDANGKGKNEGDSTGKGASGKVNAEGESEHHVKVEGSSETHSRGKTKTWRSGDWEFVWQLRSHGPCETAPCRCGEPWPKVPSGESLLIPPSSSTSQHTFKEPVRVGVADEVSLFSTTVSVVPDRKFTVPAAIRAKDGTLVAVNEVWVQLDGEDPKPLAHVGDTFTGTTPPKPAKIFTVIGTTAVGIIGLLPSGGSGGSGDPAAPPPKIADPVTPPPAGTPSSPPSAPASVTAPPDFPTKAPVVELTPRTPPEGVTPTAGPKPTTETPPVAENPTPAGTPGGTPGETGPAPTSAAPEPTPGPVASEPPSEGPTKTAEPDVRMAENEPTLIATKGVFDPAAVPAMGAELAFPDQKIRRSADAIFSTDDTVLLRTTGSADQTGDMIVTVKDPAGNVQAGTANAWTAKLLLSHEVVKEGQALAIQIVPTGLEETRLVKYRLELSADAEPLTPGAAGQTYSGETTVSALRALIFRVRYPTPGGKPMRLFLEPFPAESGTSSRSEK